MPDFSSWFFDGWGSVLRVVVAVVCGYAGLVALLRVSGKRTLSKMNAFDLVVTIALGSTLATLILSKDVSIAEGLTAFSGLIALQWLVTWTCARSRYVDRLVKNDPTIVLWRGRMLHDVLRRQRLSVEEVHSAIRAARISRIEDVAAVVLETTGDLSIVPDLPPTQKATALPPPFDRGDH